MSDKCCTGCSLVKPLTDFYKRAAVCKVCRSTLDKQKYAENKEIRLAYQRKYVTENPEKVKASQHRKYLKRRDQHKVDQKAYYEANKTATAVTMAAYKRANRAKVNHIEALRRASKKSATPAWADKSAIQEFYKESRRLTETTGIRHSVDHIVPLTSEIVCGLHCEANLQILPASENSSKRNFWWPDMPERLEYE